MEDGLHGRALYRDGLAPALRLRNGGIAAIRMLAPRIQKDATSVRGQAVRLPRRLPRYGRSASAWTALTALGYSPTVAGAGPTDVQALPECSQRRNDARVIASVEHQLQRVCLSLQLNVQERCVERSSREDSF